MKRQHLTRRIVLSAAVVGLAVLTALGGGDRVNAERIDAGGYGSKDAFKRDCGGASGEFVDSPQDKLTVCVYQDGSTKTCDQQGNKCVIVTKREETGWADPLVGSTVNATITEDTQTVAPVNAPLEAIAEAPVDAAIESQDASAAGSGTLAAPADAPVTLSEEPMVVEEPMAVEGSVEQP